MVKADRYIAKLESQEQDTTKLTEAEGEANQALIKAVAHLAKGERDEAASELDNANKILSANFPGEVYAPQPFDPTKLTP